MATVQAIAESVEKGQADHVRALILEALDDGQRPADLLSQGLIHGMEAIGVEFKHHRIYLPEVMFAARAMQAGMEMLKPLLSEGGSYFRGKIILGTVQGDLHDIGKNIVGMMLEGAGFEVIDLGVDVPPAAFLEAAQSHQASVVGLSAMLTSTMLVMKQVVDCIQSSSLRHEVRVLVGGAPASEKFAREIGAACFARDATEAVEFMRELYPEA